MSINHVAISSTSITDTQNAPAVIEYLTFRPVIGTIYSPARPPGQLVGFYNGSIDAVELYVTNNNGTQFLRVE